MTKRLIWILSIGVALVACDKQKLERARLNKQVDSLKQELVTSQKMTSTLQEVGQLIDSIDRNRHLLRTNMVEGTSFEDFQSRLVDINQYVKESERKIEELENTLKNSKSSNKQYAASLKKLKEELESRNQEVLALQEKIANFRLENENLIHTVDLQKAEIEDKLALIKSHEQESAKLKQEVQQLLVQSKIDEAEAYFARALALEEAANRTKFAPRKKRKTNQEALEMYQMALLCGKEEASNKVAMLRKKI